MFYHAELHMNNSICTRGCYSVKLQQAAIINQTISKKSCGNESKNSTTGPRHSGIKKKSWNQALRKPFSTCFFSMQNTVFENVQPAVLRLVYLKYDDKVVCTGTILTLY